MSLGLTKDSMLNLAELAAGERSNSIEVTGETDEELVMQVDTHEVAKDRSSLVAVAGLSEYARDSLGQFTPEDDAKDLAELEQLERLVRAQEEEATAVEAAENSRGGGGTSIGEGDDNSRQSSIGSETSSYGKYTGFDADYAEYDDFYVDPASYTSYAFKRSSVIPLKDDLTGKKQQGFWCCFFPWMSVSHSENIIDDGNSERSERSQTNKVGLNETLSKDDDEVSTASDVFGEKLSEKDRQAVLARLRLAQPDTTVATPPEASTTDDEHNNKEKQKGLWNGIVTRETQNRNGGLKGILRRPSSMSNPLLNKMNKQTTPNSGGDKNQRRSLFPSYDAPTKPKKNLHVEFADMARVMTVKSHKDMDESEKGDVWWQRSDYEEFRKTGRMIVRAMLEGGSEIWLASSQSWQQPNQGRTATLKSALSLSEQKKAFEKGDMNAKKQYEAARDKWWHRFGHSRRGLEHIASIDEGRQRQANVRIAIKAVVDEQRRQKTFKRSDAEKLRMVSIQHTSWARDLAMASGASDADVLRQNFDDDSRKSREFYLLKLSRSNQQGGSSNSAKVMPAFMRPAMTFRGPTNSRLDANTVSQIRYRQTQIKKKAAASSSSTTSPWTVTPASHTVTSGEAGRESMAKQAAGYASGNESLNMSAVLTGMGPMKTPATVGGP